jgi:hypothetical protein
MRWLFADPHNADEAARVREQLAAIDRWWAAFESERSKLENYVKRTTRWDLPGFMEESLQAIDPRLMWEFGPAVRQPGHRLVITPESHRTLRPMLRTILERAPQLPGWEFYGYRLAEMPEQAVQAVQNRAGVDISNVRLAASLAPGRKIDLAFVFSADAALDEDTALQAAFVTTEAILGEQLLDTWIGSINVITDDAADAPLLPLAQAQARVAALVRGSLDRLPKVRRPELAGEMAAVKLDPPHASDDYPACTDLVSASTRDLELFQMVHGGESFASACHSRFGETFCYLKLDAAEAPQEEPSPPLVEAIDSALRQAGKGCSLGVGVGVRYSYVELALSDIKPAAPILRQVLAAHGAPLRSWLLFHDDDLAAEWIGIYGQAPPPPRNC